MLWGRHQQPDQWALVPMQMQQDEPAREDGASTHCQNCGYAERAVGLSVVWKRGPRECVQPGAEPKALPQSAAFGGTQAYAKCWAKQAMVPLHEGPRPWMWRDQRTPCQTALPAHVVPRIEAILVVGSAFDHHVLQWIAPAACHICAIYQRGTPGLAQVLPIVLKCARCFLPNSHILAVTEHIMPGLFPHLADLWRVVRTTRSLGSPAFLILFTGEASQPFWPEAMVSVGSPDDNTPWVVTSNCKAPSKQLLAKPKAMEPDTPQDYRAFAASVLTPFAGSAPESSQNLACLGGLLASAAIASAFSASGGAAPFRHQVPRRAKSSQRNSKADPMPRPRGRKARQRDDPAWKSTGEKTEKHLQRQLEAALSIDRFRTNPTTKLQTRAKGF